MANDEKGATEDQVKKIDAIDVEDALGSEGSARGEHSGQNSPREKEGMSDHLADNRPDQVKGTSK
ncbi:MAG TPA: hypothetical protein VF701_04995 [Thermoanaerobaculia bacterium]